MTIQSRRIPQLDGIPFKLGRHVEHDDRSRNYRFDHGVMTLQAAMWRHYGPILNQGQLGSCTGNAITQCRVTKPLRTRAFKASEKEAVEVYSLATTLDDVPGSYPPNDTGSTGLAVAKAATQLNWISSYQHVFGVDAAKLAIVASPMICGTEWTEAMFTPDADGFIIPAGEVAGGHEYLMIGYDPTSDVFTFLNSWGRGWGVKIHGIADGGVFHMSGTSFGTLLEQQGDLVVPIK